jgi:hypothetical protein
LPAAALVSFPSCSVLFGGYKRLHDPLLHRARPDLSADERGCRARPQETGTCSWYNESKFFGLKRGNTSLGEKVMPWHLTGAHKTLPLPCLVKVTNLENGKSVKLRINDRGPFIANRHLDVTPRAAKKLGFHDRASPPPASKSSPSATAPTNARKNAAGSSSNSQHQFFSISAFTLCPTPQKSAFSPRHRGERRLRL